MRAGKGRGELAPYHPAVRPRAWISSVMACMSGKRVVLTTGYPDALWKV